MTVYVDEVHKWPHARGVFRGGSCHLTADSLEELHALAESIGCKRHWFQDHKLAPHYDLTPGMRERALAAGAVFMPAIEQATRRQAARVAAEAHAKAQMEAEATATHPGLGGSLAMGKAHRT